VQETLVTIADLTATGSSNTSLGRLKTIGKVRLADGRGFNLAPSSDCDIYTDSTGKNFMVCESNRVLFTIDLSQIDPNLPLGKTQPVIIKVGPPGNQIAVGDTRLSGSMMDIAIPPRPAQ
jgi:hypothetical protein